jgi:hypothetical protein
MIIAIFIIFEKEMEIILPKKECHSSLTLDQASLQVLNFWSAW